MPQLLLELLSEEIPARMQAAAARDWSAWPRERLAAEGLLPEALKTFAGSRRLTLVAEGLPEAQKDRTEELKGPRDQRRTRRWRASCAPRASEGRPGRARRRLLRHARASRPADAEIVAEMVEAIVRDFPWPKSMVSGLSKLRWVRPLRRILCVFDGEVVPFDIDGIPSGDTTEGHRFMGSGQSFKAKDFDAYAEKLEKHYVVLDPRSARRASSRPPRPSASPATWSWSRTRACWTRSPAWSSGRSRCWATWTRTSWTCRPR
jgi:glycyl-tRNA synthetase beta chain